MSEEQVEMSVDEEMQETIGEPEGEPADSEAAQTNITKELQELGRNLAAATKAVLESPEAHELGAQLQRGLEALDKTVHQLAGQARETKVGQTVESSVSEAATAVKEKHIFETLADSVTTALQTMNQALGQAVEKASTRSEGVKAEKSAPQQIEILEGEEEPPAKPETG